MTLLHAVPQPEGSAANLLGVIETALRRLPNRGGRGGGMISPLGEAVLLDAVAAEASGPLANLKGTSGLRRMLARSFAALGCADIGPQALSRLAERLARRDAPACAERVTELGRLYRHYRGLLGPNKLDAALAFARGIKALEQASPFAAAPPSSEIVVTGVHRLLPWDELPTPHGLMQALGALASQKPVRVVLPSVDENRPALEQALRPLLEALYARHALNLEVAWAPLGPELADEFTATPWQNFLRGLFLPASAPPLLRSGELPLEKLSLAPLPSPASEARHIARSVADLLARGVAPDSVAVLAESAPRRARIVQELLRYNVPVYVSQAPSRARRSGLILASEGEPLPAPLSLLLDIYGLFGAEPLFHPPTEPALQREGLIQLLTTRYLRWPTLPNAPAVPSGALAEALRGAGVRELTLLLGAPSSFELHRRIDEWMRQNSRRPAREKNANAGDDSASIELLRHLEGVLDELRALPIEATLTQHVLALRRLYERLQLRAGAADSASAWLGRFSLYDELDDASDAGATSTGELLAAECRALARDQATLALFEQILDELPRREQELRRHESRIFRSRFAALLRAMFQRLYRPAALGNIGLGVEVGSLSTFTPRPLAQLFFAGVLDGELPANFAEDTLLDDQERRLCNHILDAPVWPLCQQGGQRGALYFAEALAHAAAVHLSWPNADEEGRPLLRSAFVDAVLHAAAREEPAPISAALLPEAEKARHPTELWAFVTRTARQADVSAAVDTPLQTALTAYDRRRASRLWGRVRLEEARAAWFMAWATENFAAQPGPLCGQLANSELIAALAARLPGSQQRPLSASALEDYARCPFRFFVYRVLKAAPIPESGDDSDSLSRGNLYHKTLELFFRERRTSGRLPLRADDSDRQALDAALHAAVLEFTAAARSGHPGLFQVLQGRLRAELWQLIVREAKAPIEPGCTPTLFEHPFGPLCIHDAQKPLDANSQAALHIGGVIDRIDLGPGRALILDYKTGRLRRYQAYLREDLLTTAFQLPLYAAAVQADPAVLQVTGPAPRVSARFYAVRQAQVTAALEKPELFALDSATRLEAGEKNVAEVAYNLWRHLRSGDFRVAPRTCDGCGLEATCRISVPAANAESFDEDSQSSSANSAEPSSTSGSEFSA